MELTLALCLPRDAASVPLARRVTGELLTSLGFVPDEVADVELALSEACGNVIRHSRDGDDYEVRLNVDGAVVSVDVEDKGPGFPDALVGADRDHPPSEAETGRGIVLMAALLDELRFERAGENGSVVRMVRTLRTSSGSVAAHRLGAGD